jgi:hypothetical protein
MVIPPLLRYFPRQPEPSRACEQLQCLGPDAQGSIITETLQTRRQCRYLDQNPHRPPRFTSGFFESLELRMCRTIDDVFAKCKAILNSLSLLGLQGSRDLGRSRSYSLATDRRQQAKAPARPTLCRLIKTEDERAGKFRQLERQQTQAEMKRKSHQFRKASFSYKGGQSIKAETKMFGYSSETTIKVQVAAQVIMSRLQTIIH